MILKSNTVISSRHFRLFLSSILLTLFLSSAPLTAQILKDTATFNLIKKGVDHIYNLEFDHAHEVYNKISRSYEGHPIVFLFRGIMTYWQNYPLLPSSPQRDAYETDMRHCIELCEKKHDAAYEAEYLLANLGARGMLLLFYADNDLSMEVFPLATSTYQYVRQSFDFTSVYSDFYFFTGLYNYYREAYPEAHPVYKTLAFLFPKGDKAKGIKQLQLAARSSLILKAESYSFLSGICISFENNYQLASQYSKSLYQLYPANLQYLAVYIKNLLLIKRYDEAERLIKSSVSKMRNAYFQAQISIFNGILYEKKYNDPGLAQQHYSKGVKEISIFGEFGNEYAAYGYFGLSRISDATGDKNYKKIYRKQAMELASFKKVNFDE
jgi:hypothetical protein